VNKKENKVVKKWGQFLNEVVINPEQTEYTYKLEESDYFEDGEDWVLEFKDGGIDYVVSLMYFPLLGFKSYNILFTTKPQWIDFKSKSSELSNKVIITDEELIELQNNVEKETGYNRLFPIIRKLAYVIIDFSKTHLKGETIVIVDSKNTTKIKFYRNIISSFKEVEDLGVKEDDYGNRCFLYKIN